jgi:hypothetical protein
MFLISFIQQKKEFNSYFLLIIFLLLLQSSVPKNTVLFDELKFENMVALSIIILSLYLSLKRKVNNFLANLKVSLNI